MVKQKVFFANITYSYFQKTLKTDMWIYQQVKMNDVLRSTDEHMHIFMDIALWQEYTSSQSTKFFVIER